MTIKQLCEQAHAMAKEKGFHDEPKSPLECIALMHSELSEAVEAFRIDPDEAFFMDDSGITDPKPEGWLVELADCVIRIADFVESAGYDLEAAIEVKIKYNGTRPYMHGKKI